MRGVHRVMEARRCLSALAILRLIRPLASKPGFVLEHSAVEELTRLIMDTVSSPPPSRQLTNGTPSVAVTVPYTSWSLYDFWFGCVLRSSTPVVTQPLQCTVTVAGFVRNSGQEVAVASYTFTPPRQPA